MPGVMKNSKLKIKNGYDTSSTTGHSDPENSGEESAHVNLDAIITFMYFETRNTASPDK